MKIDFHVHITPPEIIKNWEKYAQNEPHFSLLSNSKNNKFVEAEDVIASLDKEGFDKAVVFGFAFQDMGLCRFVNDYVIEKVKEFPEKLLGFSVVSAGKEAAHEIERCYKNGLKGVGELFPEGQNIDIENEKETITITDACKAYSIPLLLHTNENVGHDYAGKSNTSLWQIEKFINNNQGLDIVLAHLGGGLLFYETKNEIREKFKNVYYDTAAMPFLYEERVYNVIKALGLYKKVLFGSDFPLLSLSRYIDIIDSSALSEEENRLIMGENAQKLLKI